MKRLSSAGEHCGSGLCNVSLDTVAVLLQLLLPVSSMMMMINGGGGSDGDGGERTGA